MSDASDTLNKKGLGARVTLRLSERELTALRDLAEAREEDLTSIIREAIGAYLRREKEEATHRAEYQRLAADMAAGVKREADRVIERLRGDKRDDLGLGFRAAQLGHNVGVEQPTRHRVTLRTGNGVRRRARSMS